LVVAAFVASGLGGRTAAVLVTGIAVDVAFTIGGGGVARALGGLTGASRHSPTSSRRH
jgi:hypothetical protein